MRDQIKDYSQVQNKLLFLFKVINTSFQSQIKAHNLANQSVQTMTVELNINELVLTFQSILLKQTSQKSDFKQDQKICGLSPADYYRAITFTKYQTIEVLPSLTALLGCTPMLPFVVNQLPAILKQMTNEISNSDVKRHFD